MKSLYRGTSRFRSARAVGGSLFGAIGVVLVAASTAWACTVAAAAYLFVVPPGGTDYLVTKAQIQAVDPLPNDPDAPVDVDTEDYQGGSGMPIAVVGYCGGGAQACGTRQAPRGYVGTMDSPVAIGGLYMAPHSTAPPFYFLVDTGVPIRDPQDAFGTKTEGDVTSEQTDCSAGSTRIGQVIYNKDEISFPTNTGKAPLTVVAGEGQIPNTVVPADQDALPDGQTGSTVPLETGKYVICADPLPRHIWNFFTVIL